jgi:hypothetical protein
VTSPPRITIAIRVLDLVSRDVADDCQRYERESGRESRHQDRRQPLLRAAHHQRGPERLAFFTLEMLEVVDHQDPVARGDAEHRQEAHERAK